jgi:Ankyrin repeat
MDNVADILIAFELHSVEGIRACFANGVDPNMDYEGKPLVYALINMYARGPLFKSCIRAFVDHGLIFPDKVLLTVLLDDAAALETELSANKDALQRRYTFDCTFTPLYEATLLHISAEYNHKAAAAVLVQHGADINAVAGIDEKGFGGQTPIFHTVNQHDNRCLDMLQFLLANKADLQLTVKGLIWGKGYPWETFIPAVNPLSYAMMGLLRQFQRTEEQIYAIVSLLMKAAYGIDYVPGNIPNKYLVG